ncbi:TonB-dependent siderophore receptor [Horticoccus sp. 23ND18S-11]|uniref:TonB-dependent siderophore receptor n=1 Tax=Horticoccus sp. 23ND18S-11 TaxID=3391832 RepID=UPI0039C9CC15
MHLIRLRLLASVIVTALLCAATAGFAQKAPAPAASAGAAADAAVQLSPFTVSTDKDVGFVATSSLAGGRLASDLADTPAAYSVITREFIDALNIVDLAQALEWTVNTNANNDNGANLTFASPTTYTTRGVGSSTPQRNFFPFYLNFDSYNLERFDFSRGPNSVLFGNGNIAGSANVVTKQAKYGRPLREIRTQIGSWETYRASLDVNQPVGKDAAVRANAVWQNGRGWRERDFAKVKGAALTGSMRLGAATEIRLEGEYGENSRMSGFSNVNDSFAGWDGTSTFDAPLTATPTNNNARGVTRNAAAGYFVYAPASGFSNVMNYQNTALTLGAGANTAVPIAGRFFAGTTVNASGADLLNSLNLPDDRFANAIRGSQFRVPGRAFSPSFDAPVFWQRYHDVALYINHAIGRSLFFELALDKNYSFRAAEITLNRGLVTTLIDINRNLPNGAPNPNFLQPYSEAVRHQNPRNTDAKNVRGAIAYVKDTRFGNFKFNSLFGTNIQDTYGRLTLLGARIDPDPRRWSLVDLIRYRYYWNQDGRPLPQLGKIQLVDPVLGTTREVTPFYTHDTSRPEVNSNAKATYNYALAAMNAQFFKRRLVVLGAVRFDDYTNKVTYNSFIRDYPADWDGTTLIFKPDAPSDYRSLTYVPKDAQGRPTGPASIAERRPRDAAGNRLAQYAGERFQDDYSPPPIEGTKTTYSAGSVYHLNTRISLYGNFAQTYNLPSVTPTLTGSPLPATVSNGFDAGVRFSLLDQRLRLSLNRYFSKEDNQASGAPANTSGPINAIINSNAIGDFSADGRNNRGVQPLPAVFTDRRQQKANGYEFEAVANLSRAWRLSANYAIARAFSTNAGIETATFIDNNLTVLRQIVVDAGGLIDAQGVATVDNSIPVNQRSPDANTAVTNWNTLLAGRRGIVSGTVISQNTTSANLFTDYSIQTGRFKGLRVGAGARYRGRAVIGNRGADTIVNPANPAQGIDDPNVDAFTVVYAPGYWVATATVGYNWRLSKKYEVRFNLSIDNLLDDDKVRFTSTILRPPGGDVTNPARVTVPNSYWYQAPRSYSLAATVPF